MEGFPITAEISAGAIRSNLRALRSRLPAGIPLCAAVKANAYGHGIGQVLPVLQEAGVERIAVAHLPEARQAREQGWSRPILCLGAIVVAASGAERQECARQAIDLNLHCTVATPEEVQILAAEAARSNRPARVEVKIDTGMGRMGVRADQAAAFVAEAAGKPGILVEGIYTHLASADEDQAEFTREQIDLLQQVREQLSSRGIRVKIHHAANSAGVFRIPEAGMTMARPGLAVYGYWAGPAGERPADLRPCLRVVGRLVAVRRLPPGHGVGYGRTFTTRRESTIGVVPIGYADGYRRLLSNSGVMTLAAVRGQPARSVPVVGRVSMDQTTIDLTDAGDTRVGDPVIIISDDPAASNGVESMARQLGTIPYEVTCLLGNRVERLPVP